MRATVLSALALIVATAAPADNRTKAASKGSPCVPSVENNRVTVLAFYDGLIRLQPRKAFTTFMSKDFIEHKPDVASGNREGAATFLEGLIAAVPQPRWEVLRTVAEGDLVYVHARFTPAAGTEPYAIADLFRLKDCLIVEHWDVVAPPVKGSKNPNSRF